LTLTHYRKGALLALLVLPALTGCYRTTHAVIPTHAPPQVLSGSLDDLVKKTTSRFDAIHTFTAAVEMQVSTGGGKEGKVVDYVSFSGHILIRQPNDFRFVALVPIAHTRMVDLVTDGKTFTLVIPPQSKAITGSNAVTTPSDKAIENLRPSMFIDSLLIRSAQQDELVSLVSDDRIYQPKNTKKYLIDEPEYDLGIYRTSPNSSELKTQRVIHLGRETLLPFQQDVYDEKGQLVTVATYDDYKLFGDTTFASHITIRRPIDQFTVHITITQLSVNQTIEDDQFEKPRIPSNYQLRQLP
jgi:outer membrane lipoprotein-sorting protein